MEEFLNSIPLWLKTVILFITGGGAGGAGVHQWYKTKLNSDKQDFELRQAYRFELKKDLDTLRKRQDDYELELAETRHKYFEMQEKYHQLKLHYDATVQENKLMREELVRMREEIQKLRKELNE